MPRIASNDGPDPIDVHVGKEMRLFRTLKGMSQERLARELGVTFQQVQKYERGFNRVSASMLYRAAQALDVPVSAFFDRLERPRPDLPAHVADRFSLAMFAELDELPPQVRDTVRALIRSLAKTSKRGNRRRA
jgi:transcriptional regulator with XRE-family HTH domain